MSLLGVSALILITALVNCRQAMTPLARAFGAPPESKLAKCRAAFRQLQGELDHSTLRVAPVLTVDERGATWRRKLAVALHRELAPHTKAKLLVPADRPTVATTPFGHNQLRYLWVRAAAYTQALQAARPAADFVLQGEIFAHGGKVGAIQVYIFTADGQVAYCRLFNSHHFGPDLGADDEAPLQFIVRHLVEDLHREAQEIFPPDGVG